MSIDQELISPCGMNCAVCSGYLAYKYDVRNQGLRMPYCKGCRPRNKQCAFIKKRCQLLLNNEVKYCYECIDYPCKGIKHLDKRYRTKYSMSMIENLDNIKKLGIRKFIENEKIRWSCKKCGGTINVHKGFCYLCGKKK